MIGGVWVWVSVSVSVSHNKVELFAEEDVDVLDVDEELEELEELEKKDKEEESNKLDCTIKDCEEYSSDFDIKETDE